MILSAGARVGPYEVVGTLGQGGMGEVYRAHDTRLGRDVALKVLPARLSADLDRIARFEREAHVLASLNHPHIAQIYGIEESKGTSLGDPASVRALVMELVEGDTLEEHLKQGPLPLDEALPLARQIAEALEAAHEQGIVHRDLKPANIKITPDHQVKVLDFGLAKLIEQGDGASGGGAGEGGGGTFARAAAARAPQPAAAPQRTPDTQSPTVLHPAVTSNAGMLLGTAAYMSPEQARGRPADRRSDVWAFGCVLFEMLTGARAFQGDDVADTLAAILRSEPQWTLLPGATPPAIRRLLRRALVKDRRQRLADITTARLDLQDAAAETSLEAPVGAATRKDMTWRRVPWIVAILAVTLLAVMAVLTFTRPRAESGGAYRAQIVPPTELASVPALRFALSPDGGRMAFVAPDAEGRVTLWVRQLDGLTSQSLAGTDGANAPFWSPDGRRIAFFAGGKLKTIDIGTGAMQTLADAGGVPPGAWIDDTAILFANGTASPLFRISATGGTPEAVTALDQEAGETAHVFPSMLPDGRHFIFNATAGQSSRGTWIGSLDSTDRTRLLEEGTNAAYAGGYVFYVRDTTLVAHPFDASRLTFTGEPVSIAEDVQINPIGGRLGAFSLSRSGVLAYQASGVRTLSRLSWFERTGERQGNISELGEYADLALSPDQQYAATSVLATAGLSPDVWLFGVRQGMRARVTFGAASTRPVWTPDGKRVAYSVQTAESLDIRWRPIDGSGPEEDLLATPADEHPLSFSRDGRYLLYGIQGSPTRNSIWVLPLTGDRKPFDLVPENVNNASAEFSPDGTRVAYGSNETGRNEVFVAAFPPPGAKWQVSTNGGVWPRWRRDGREIYFIAPDRKLMAVPVAATGTGLEVGTARAPFEMPRVAGARYPYDVSANGERFLLNAVESQPAVTPIMLIINWPALVTR